MLICRAENALWQSLACWWPAGAPPESAPQQPKHLPARMMPATVAGRSGGLLHAPHRCAQPWQWQVQMWQILLQSARPASLQSHRYEAMSHVWQQMRDSGAPVSKSRRHSKTVLPHCCDADADFLSQALKGSGQGICSNTLMMKAGKNTHLHNRKQGAHQQDRQNPPAVQHHQSLEF